SSNRLSPTTLLQTLRSESGTGLPSIGDVSARFASASYFKPPVLRNPDSAFNPSRPRSQGASFLDLNKHSPLLGAPPHSDQRFGCHFRSAPKIRCHSIFIRDAAEMFQNREALVGLAARNPFEEGKGAGPKRFTGVALPR